MTKFMGRRARQQVQQYQQEAAGAGKRKRRRSNERLVKEGIFMPVIIKDYTDGIPTSNGMTMSSFDLEHLVSGETFSATVFEGLAPNYIDEKILDAVLPEDLEEFVAEDLVGRGFNVKVKFNERNGRTYTNIVGAEELDPEDQAIVEEKLEAKEKAKQRFAKDIQETEDMLSEMPNHGSSSNGNDQMEEVSMEQMEAPDPYTHGAVRRGSAENESESTSFNNRPDRQRKSKRVSQVIEDNFGSDDIDEESEEYNNDLDELYICDACKDTGCEECGEDTDEVLDDSCPHCDDIGCEFCDDDYPEETEENDNYNRY